MITITAAKLKNSTGLVLERAVRGKSTAITRYGRVIAVVHPALDDEQEAA